MSRFLSFRCVWEKVRAAATLQTRRADNNPSHTACINKNNQQPFAHKLNLRPFSCILLQNHCGLFLFQPPLHQTCSVYQSNTTTTSSRSQRLYHHLCTLRPSIIQASSLSSATMLYATTTQYEWGSIIGADPPSTSTTQESSSA